MDSITACVFLPVLSVIIPIPVRAPTIIRITILTVDATILLALAPYLTVLYTSRGSTSSSLSSVIFVKLVCIPVVIVSILLLSFLCWISSLARCVLILSSHCRIVFAISLSDIFVCLR